MSDAMPSDAFRRCHFDRPTGAEKSVDRWECLTWHVARTKRSNGFLRFGRNDVEGGRNPEVDQRHLGAAVGVVLDRAQLSTSLQSTH
jgi:hypothetical protein